MRLFQSKIYFTLLVIILTVSPNACLVEQAIAEIANALPGGHHEHHNHDQQDAAPSHNHDKEGSKTQFCCDNNLNFYLLSNTVSQFIMLERPVPFPSQAANFDEPTKSIKLNYYRDYYRHTPTLRGRDKYALNCLLHAPPR